MKTCPFCAEEIQDAAIVCKHCGRDLVAGPSPGVRTEQRRGLRVWAVLAWIAIGLIVLIAIASLLPDDPKLAAFKQERAAWHARCDQYVNKRLVTAEARACNDELNRLIAYGKSQGW